MATYTAPTTRTSGELITASIWNTDLVENIKYFKDSPSITALTTTGAITAGGNITTSATKKIAVNAGATSYITETSGVALDVYANAVQLGRFYAGATSSLYGNWGTVAGNGGQAGNFTIPATAKLYLDGGGDTYVSEYTSNGVRFTVGGVSALYVFASTLEAPVVYSSTTGSAANVYVDSNGWLQRSTSSLRYKHDVETLNNADAMAAVMAMRPVTYRGKTDEDQRRHIGFIAEEMQQIAPLLCTYDEGGEDGTPNYVTYDRVTAYLVSVVQQQQAEINALKARIN